MSALSFSSRFIVHSPFKLLSTLYLRIYFVKHKEAHSLSRGLLYKLILLLRSFQTGLKLAGKRRDSGGLLGQCSKRFDCVLRLRTTNRKCNFLRIFRYFYGCELRRKSLYGLALLGCALQSSDEIGELLRTEDDIDFGHGSLSLLATVRV